MTTVAFNLNLESLVAIAGAILVALGVVLVVLGRGRRIDDHPVCRKCGYDLTGKPESSMRCSECGADLSRRRAIRVGNRVRRSRMIRAGVVGILLGLLCPIWSGYRYVISIDWLPHLPLGWLVSDAESAAVAGTAATTPNRALGELFRRMESGLLSAQDQRWLVEHLLSRNSDPAKPLSDESNALLAAVLKRVWLSDEQIERCVRQIEAQITHSVVSSLKMNGTLKRGSPIKLNLGLPNPSIGVRLVNVPGQRAGSIYVHLVPFMDPMSPVLPLAVSVNLMSSYEVLTLDRQTFYSFPGAAGMQGHAASIHPDWDRVANIPDGPHELAVRVRFQGTAQLPSGQRRISFEVEAKRQVELVSGKRNDP